MLSEARAEAERRWPTDYREPNGVIRAMNEARQQGWYARGEWQATRPFTEEDVEAAASAVARRYGEEVDAGYRKDARAALDAVTARHKEKKP